MPKLPFLQNSLTTIAAGGGFLAGRNAFGSGMAARKTNFGSSYRFGMNTQEKEVELGEGVTSAEFWMYDGKLERRWNADPVYKYYESVYSSLANNPIIFIDLLGNDTFQSKYTGEITQKKDKNRFDVFIFLDSSGNNHFLKNNQGSTNFNKNKKGLIEFPKMGLTHTNNGSQTKFLRPFETVAIFGASFVFCSETGQKMVIGQLNDENHRHSGGGPYAFSCLDIMYARKTINGKTLPATSAVNTSLDPSSIYYDQINSQKIVNILKKFGWDNSSSILTEIYDNNTKTYKEALKGTIYPGHGGPTFFYHHRHHMHLQKFNDSHIKEVIKI